MHRLDPQEECLRHFDSIEDFYEQIDFNPHIEFDNWLMGDGAECRPNVQRDVAADMASTLDSWIDECDRQSRNVVAGSVKTFEAHAEMQIFLWQQDQHEAAPKKYQGRKYLVDGMPGFIASSEYGLSLWARTFAPPRFIPWGDISYIEPLS